MSVFASISANDLVWLVAAMLLGGTVSGVLAGLFGVGGGALLVPVLAELFDRMGVRDDVIMQLAVGTSLAIIIPTASRAYFSHRAHDQVDVPVLRLWIAPVALGAATGVAIAAYVSSDALKGAFAAFGFAMAANLIFGKEDLKIADDLPARWITRAFGYAIGVMSALVGIGGGAPVTMFLNAYGRPFHKAIGTSSGLGGLVAVPGAIGFAIAGWPHMADLPPLSLGYVSLIGFAIMSPVAVLTTPLGVRLSRGLTRRQLKVAFGCYLALVATRLVISLIG